MFISGWHLFGKHNTKRTDTRWGVCSFWSRKCKFVRPALYGYDPSATGVVGSYSAKGGILPMRITKRWYAPKLLNF